jgi:hypothetical protein
MGRHAQALRRGGGPVQYGLAPPVFEVDWTAVIVASGITAVGGATCEAPGLLIRWRLVGSPNWLGPASIQCDESQEVQTGVVVGQVWEVQASWYNGFNSVSDWSLSVVLTVA